MVLEDSSHNAAARLHTLFMRTPASASRTRGVLWRSSAPFAGPDWRDRAHVLLISTLGFGLLVALPLLLRRELRVRRTSEEAGDAPAT